MTNEPKTPAVAPQSDHEALRCTVGNCTFNGEVLQHSATCPNRPAAEAVPAGIYVASRASLPERPAHWRALRTAGWPIVSTWIDEAGPGETDDAGELWARIAREVASAQGVVLHVEPDDFPLKGALVEVGMALSLGKRVGVYAAGVALEGRSMRPLGSWAAHPLVRITPTLQGARDWIEAAPQPPAQAPAAVAGPKDAQWALAMAEAEERAQAHFSAGMPQPPAEAQEPAKRGKWLWVPEEPSTAMLVAGNHGQPGDFSALKVWNDMLGALQRSFDYTRPVDPPVRQAPQQAVPAPWPIAPDVAADLERSDWTPEEALRWYAAGRHYDTVPNGDGTSSARILDTGEVATNALRAYDDQALTGEAPGRHLAEHVLGMDFVTDRGLRARELARKVLSQDYAASAVPTSEQAGAPTDEDEALDLLEVLFDAWEDGTPCYEDPDTQGAFLGQAFRLDGATFYRCANILNRRRSRDATVPASGGAAPVTNIAPSDMVEVCREDANNYCRILRVLGMEDEGDAAAEVKRLHAAQATPGLSEQDAGLLEQGALMLEALSGDERNRGNDSAAMGADCSAHAVRRLAAKLLAAPVVEGDARQVGLIAAADYIDGLASGYAAEHSYTEPDTGAVVFDRRDAGLEYHSTLVELADDLRGMAARAQAKGGTQ